MAQVIVRENESLESALKRFKRSCARDGVMSELRKREHITVILITHYMEEVVDADHVFVMDHGHVVMQGTPREIFSQVDTLKHYRLDVPQVTILADELRKRGLDIPAGVLKKEELVEILCRLN